MIVNNNFRHNSTNFGASEKKTAALVQKWTQQNRPDKLVLMLTRDDYPSAFKRWVADFNASWRDKESTQTQFFREFSKKIVSHPKAIGQRGIVTEAHIVRPDLFHAAIKAVEAMMDHGNKTRPEHKEAAIELYKKHTTPLPYRRISREIPELQTILKKAAEPKPVYCHKPCVSAPKKTVELDTQAELQQPNSHLLA